jgi:hypothetical protein
MKQQEWVLTRKKLLRKIKAQVLDRLGTPPTAFRRYAKKIVNEFRGRWRACEPSALLEAIGSSQVVFGSDFHAHAQSQRAHVRVLRSLPTDRDVFIGLECVAQEDQEALDQLILGKITEDEFLKLTEWEKFWGFPWDHYRPLFDLAKARGWPMFGLSRKEDVSPKASLEKRDERMAEDVAALNMSAPDALVYVLVGELHLANPHLPEVWQALMPKGRFVTIHQDSETLYFKLAESAKDQSVEILRNGPRFCLMVSPPWVKWQSYLTYLEKTYDRELDEESGLTDQSDHLKNLIEILARDFDLEISTTNLQVYTPESREALKALKKNLHKKDWPLLEYHLTCNRSFLLPQSGLIYLSSATVNRAASMAGEFIHAQMAGRHNVLWNGMENFEALIWTEAVAFFFSKWINPKRKSETIETLKHQLTMLSMRDRGREALLLALDQRMSDVLTMTNGKKRAVRFRPQRKTSVLEAARILGTMTGENLFVAVRSGRVSVKDVCDWLKYPVEEKDFSRFYLSLIKRMR